jgi:diguanylate cyclase (GGDEF)-like protein/PAS domain S-box-containing protein
MPHEETDRPRILIVDDMPANLLTLRRLLAGVDADIVEAGSGNAALAALLEQEVALVLLDVAMPDMDGYEVAEYIRSVEQTRRIPIVFVTAAYKDEAHRIQGYASGAVDYIEKPIQDAILLAKVRVFLELWHNATRLRRAVREIATVNVALETEIAQRRQAEERLRLAASVFSEANEGILITDPEANILEVNRAFTRLTGYAYEEAIGKNPRFLQSGHQNEVFYTAMWTELLRNGHWQGELWNRRKDGRLYVAQTTINAVRNADGAVSHYVGLSFDITEQKQHQERIEHLAFHDALTQLPNRILLADRIRQALIWTDRHQRLMAVCYLDLDGFKPVNDQFGHKAGDRLLIEVAQRLQNAVRSQDTVARLGGDEFVLLLTDLATAAETEDVLARVLKAISAPYPLEQGQATSVSASIGVTHYPHDRNDADTLLRHADQAMYQAKQSGRHRVHVFDPGQEQRASQHHQFRERVRQALENREFVLHWQPKIDMRRGEVVGAEALIRWPQPDGTWISPACFLPNLEHDNLIVELGDWVLREALRQLAAWQTRGITLRISVNVAAQQLRDEAFPGKILALFRDYPALSPAQLELEIVETAAIDDLDRVGRIMRACQRGGIDFALDDFGTGYSSMLYFRRLPARTIKIDQSFVRDMLKDRDDLALIEGILGMTRAFGKTVVAEGVESLEHGRLLLQLGCHLGQGFGLARPMPGEELPVWLRSWRMPDLDPRPGELSAPELAAGGKPS